MSRPKCKLLIVDEMAMALLPHDLSDFTSLSTSDTLIAVRSSAHRNCSFSSLSILIRGSTFLYC